MRGGSCIPAQWQHSPQQRQLLLLCRTHHPKWCDTGGREESAQPDTHSGPGGLTSLPRGPARTCEIFRSMPWTRSRVQTNVGPKSGGIPHLGSLQTSRKSHSKSRCSQVKCRVGYSIGDPKPKYILLSWLRQTEFYYWIKQTSWLLL